MHFLDCPLELKKFQATQIVRDHFQPLYLYFTVSIALAEVHFWSFRRIKHFIYNTFTHFGLSSVALFYVFRIFVVCCLRLALSSGNSKSFLMRKVSTETKRGSAGDRDRDR